MSTQQQRWHREGTRILDAAPPDEDMLAGLPAADPVDVGRKTEQDRQRVLGAFFGKKN
jgi:hypothetical protein